VTVLFTWNCAIKSPLDPEGENIGAITRVPALGRKITSVCWSPDGEQIAYAEQNGDGVWGIYVFHVTTRTTSVLREFDQGHRIYDLDWSPDKTQIVYSEAVGDDSFLGATAYPAGSNDVVEFQSCQYVTFFYSCLHSPSWSPNGTRLALLVFESPSLPGPCGSGGQISVLNVGSLGCEPHTAWQADDGNGGLRWAKAGNRVAYHYIDDPTPYWHIAIQDLDDNSIVAATGGATNDMFPDWQSTGENLVFVSDRGGGSDVWVVDSGGARAPLQLTFDGSPKSCPRWSPVADTVCYVVEGAVNFEIRIVELPAIAR
jgi:Tol biopolymer transport system component